MYLFGEVSVGEMSVGEVSVGEVSVGDVSVGEMSVGEVSGHRFILSVYPTALCTKCFTKEAIDGFFRGVL